MRNGGFTLVELIVVVAILGLIAGMTGVAFASLRLPRASAWDSELRRAREWAIVSGKPARASQPLSSSTALYRPRGPLFLPDGRAIGTGADPLTGAPLDSAR